jgi:hypothetical protein
MIRFIFALVGLYFSVALAITYGGIWHSQSHPTPNVQVRFADGTTESGTLKRAWNRNWVLTKDSGSELRFSDDAKVSLSFTPTDKKLDYWQQWRAWGPVVLAYWGFLLFAVWPWLRLSRKWVGYQSTSKREPT